jgi:hypothetical protein
MRDTGALRLRRPPTSSTASVGSQTAAALKILPPEPPKGFAEAVETVAVWMVSVFVSVPADEVNETDCVAKLQEKYAGSVPQAKFTGPVKPPCGVIVRLTVPEP